MDMNNDVYDPTWQPADYGNNDRDVFTQRALLSFSRGGRAVQSGCLKLTNKQKPPKKHVKKNIIPA